MSSKAIELDETIDFHNISNIAKLLFDTKEKFQLKFVKFFQTNRYRIPIDIITR